MRTSRIGAGLQIEAFLSWLVVQKGASDATQKAYGADLVQLAVFLREQGADLARPGEVSRKHIQAFLAWLFRRGRKPKAHGPQTGRRALLFPLLLRSGRVSEMWRLRCAIHARKKHHPRALNVDETFALLDTPKPRRHPRPTPRACSAGIWPGPNCSMARACAFPKH